MSSSCNNSNDPTAPVEIVTLRSNSNNPLGAYVQFWFPVHFNDGGSTYSNNTSIYHKKLLFGGCIIIWIEIYSKLKLGKSAFTQLKKMLCIRFLQRSYFWLDKFILRQFKKNGNSVQFNTRFFKKYLKIIRPQSILIVLINEFIRII